MQKNRIKIKSISLSDICIILSDIFSKDFWSSARVYKIVVKHHFYSFYLSFNHQPPKSFWQFFFWTFSKTNAKENYFWSKINQFFLFVFLITKRVSFQFSLSRLKETKTIQSQSSVGVFNCQRKLFQKKNWNFLKNSCSRKANKTEYIHRYTKIHYKYTKQIKAYIKCYNDIWNT